MNKLKKVLVVGVLVGAAVAAQAQEAADPFAAAIAKLTSAPVAISAIAASMAAIAAGVMIWAKVRKYFGKGG